MQQYFPMNISLAIEAKYYTTGTLYMFVNKSKYIRNSNSWNFNMTAVWATINALYG